MIKDFYIEREIKTVYNNEGVESVHLSITVKCARDDFPVSVKRVARDLAAADLENVEKISIILEASD